MWIFTTQGFYSVVAHRDDPELVIVRARVRADIEALAAQIPEIETFEDRSADYRFRAIVSRADWVAAAAQLVTEIDYDNFKNAVGDRQGPERAHGYMAIWLAMHELQEREGDEAG